jgi:ABC-type antimicrobial peptide transport system permease subunit
VQSNLAQVKTLFEKYNPAYPFDYSFADEDFKQKFATINMTQRLAVIFSFLSIVITGLGLFGLAAYTAQQRTKEIGIRKVLGASVSSLVSLMSRDFSKLVIVSFFFSFPVAWYLLDNYLDRYPIRTEIVWWIFPVVGITALSFALAIVINQAMRSAQANPVKSLRNE